MCQIRLLRPVEAQPVASVITKLKSGKDTWPLVISDKNEATAVADAIKSKDKSQRLQLE
ncbi:hypothetical protein QYM36_006754, partial [Artemia franciscana]